MTTRKSKDAKALARACSLSGAQAARERKGRGKGKTKSDLSDRLHPFAAETAQHIVTSSVATLSPNDYFADAASTSMPPVSMSEGVPNEAGYDLHMWVGFVSALISGIVVGIVGIMTARWPNGLAASFREGAVGRR